MSLDESDFKKFHFRSPDMVDRKWLEWFREEYGRQFAKVDPTFQPVVPPHLRLTTRMSHGLSIARMSLSPLHSRNIVEFATDDDLVLGLPLKGAVTVQFGDEEVAIGNSKIVLLANDIGHGLSLGAPVDGFALRLQRSLLDQLVPNLSRCGVQVDRAKLIGRALANELSADA